MYSHIRHKNNRSTGRSTRIKNFAVDQFISVGGVIIADHTAFEPEGWTRHLALTFVDEICEQYHKTSYAKRTDTYCKFDVIFKAIVPVLYTRDEYTFISGAGHNLVMYGEKRLCEVNLQKEIDIIINAWKEYKNAR